MILFYENDLKIFRVTVLEFLTSLLEYRFDGASEVLLTDNRSIYRGDMFVIALSTMLYKRVLVFAPLVKLMMC